MVKAMKVKELIAKLEGFDQNAEVMTKKTEILGNIGEVNSCRIDSYGFFGMAIPCVLLTDEYGERKDNG